MSSDFLPSRVPTLSFKQSRIPSFFTLQLACLLLVCFHTPTRVQRYTTVRSSHLRLPPRPPPMSEDSPASTQVPLTPQSTGSVGMDSSPSGQDKPDPFPWSNKQRRQVAFFPNLNSSNKPQKPFSRSAAGGESVMTLGSIGHLQHYFTKTGLGRTSSEHPITPFRS